MYKDYYQLKEFPFNITADPDFFYSSTKHDDALAQLLYGIHERKGIMVISGEIGTGKTTLCRALLDKLGSNVKTALILNPNLSDIQLIQTILQDLGLPTHKKNKFELMNTLNNYLLEQSNQNNNVVIIIDESQNLRVKQLEQVRMLSNLETQKDKLLQIILVGQPELLEKLKLPELRQLNQRVAIRFHLQPLTKEELIAYIKHRLFTARKDSNEKLQLQFTKQAIDALYDFTKGTPRMINILCDRALLACFVSESNKINEQIINQCAQEVILE